GNVSALAGLRDDSRYLQISAPVQPGNSGGPLLDTSGHVIGIVTGELNAARVAKFTGDIPQNVNFGLKAEVAKTFLDSKASFIRQRVRNSNYRQRMWEILLVHSQSISAARLLLPGRYSVRATLASLRAPRKFADDKEAHFSSTANTEGPRERARHHWGLALALSGSPGAEVGGL